MKISHEQLVKIINEEISVHLKEQDVEEGLADLFRGKQDISHYKHMPTKQTNIPSFKNMVADLEKYKNAKDRQNFLLNIITMIIKPELYTLSEASGDKSLTNQLKSIGDHLTKAYDSLSKVNFGSLQVPDHLKRTAAMQDKKPQSKPEEEPKDTIEPSKPDVEAIPEKPAARRYLQYTGNPELKGKQAHAITPGEATPEEKAKARSARIVQRESSHTSSKIFVKLKE